MKPLVVLIDSGVHLEHPHLRGSDVTIGPTFVTEVPDHDIDAGTDTLGHGTCATAALLDLAPSARVLSLKVFGDDARCSVEALLAAIDATLALDPPPQYLLMPLGLRDRRAASVLRPRVAEAKSRGITVVAPLLHQQLPSYPGSLPGAVGVLVDVRLPREAPERRDGMWFASPHPRDLPSIERDRNLRGASFAAANLVGAWIAGVPQEEE